MWQFCAADFESATSVVPSGPSFHFAALIHLHLDGHLPSPASNSNPHSALVRTILPYVEPYSCLWDTLFALCLPRFGSSSDRLRHDDNHTHTSLYQDVQSVGLAERRFSGFMPSTSGICLDSPAMVTVKQPLDCKLGS